MPLPNTIVPPFPNVPRQPGVPPLLAGPATVLASISIAVSDAQEVLGLFLPPQWGLFFQGQPAVTADSVFSMDFRVESRVSSNPQEQGAFASYNKVRLPSESRMVFSQGGTSVQKTNLIAQLIAAQQSTALFTVVTPDAEIANVTVTRLDYSRSQRSGAGLLQVDVWLEAINVVGAPQFSNTATASGADPVDGGTVQATAPNSTQLPPQDGVS